MESCSALSFTMFASSAARLLRRGRQIGFVMAACCLLQECVDKTTVCDSCDMCTTHVLVVTVFTFQADHSSSWKAFYHFLNQSTSVNRLSNFVWTPYLKRSTEPTFT